MAKTTQKDEIEQEARLDQEEHLGEGLPKSLEQVRERADLAIDMAGERVEEGIDAVEERLTKEIFKRLDEGAALTDLLTLKSLAALYKGDYETFCKEVYEEYKEGKKQKEEAEKEPKKPKDWLKVSTETKVVIGLGIVGAIGAYSAWSWLKSKFIPFGKKKSFPTIRVVLGAVAAGALVGGGLKKYLPWVESFMGAKVPKEKAESLVKATAAKAKDKIKKLPEALSDFAVGEIEGALGKAAKFLSINGLYLKWIEKKTFQEFKEGKEAWSKGVKGTAVSALDAFGIEMHDEHGSKLLKFIEENRAALGTASLYTMTIGEILERFEKEGVFEAAEAPSEEAFEEAKKIEWLKLDAAKWPRTHELLDRFNSGEKLLDEKGTEMALHSVMFKFVDTVMKDGGALVFEEGAAFLVKEDVKWLVSSYEVTTGLLEDAALLFFTENGSSENLVMNFLENGGGWFMAEGAVVGGILSLKNGTSAFREVTTRALRAGVFSPVEIMRHHVELGQWVQQHTRRGIYTLAEWSSLSSAKKVDFRLKRFELHRKWFLDYYELSNKATAETASFGKFSAKLHKLIFPGRTLVLSKRHAIAAAEELRAIGIDVPENSLLRTNDESLEELFKKLQILNMDELRRTARAKAGLVDAPLSKSARRELLKKASMAESAIGRMDDLNIPEDELNRLAREAAANPMGGTRRALEKVLSKPSNVELANYMLRKTRELGPKLAKGGKVIGPAMIIFDIYRFDAAEDKADFIARESAITVSALSAAWAIGRAIPNPWISIPTSLAVAIGVSIGGDKLWSKYVYPEVEKNFPNRNTGATGMTTDTLGKYISLTLTGSSVYRMGRFYADEYLGLGDDVDPDTDPLEYLGVSYEFFNIYTHKAKNLFFDKRAPHDIEDLQREAKKTQDDLKEDLKELQAEGGNLEKEEQLKADIEKLEMLIDGRWIIKLDLELMQSVQMLDSIEEEFAKKAEDQAAFAAIMESVKDAEDRKIEEGAEMETWKKLFEESVALGEEDIRFGDFVAATTMIYGKKRFLENIYKQMEKEPGSLTA